MSVSVRAPVDSLEAFLGSVGAGSSVLEFPSPSPIRIMQRDFPRCPPIGLDAPFHPCAQPFLPASPLRSNVIGRYRTINLLSIAYASRPRLRPRLTLGGRTFPRKPWAFDGGDSHSSFRYSYRHSHFQSLQHPFRCAFNAPGTLPYHDPEGSSATSVLCLAPLHFRRSATRPVSYYALFKWWLLLSQHPGCLGNATSFPT